MKNSPYLDKPFVPLAVALPRMLENIGVELPMAGPAEAQRLRQRAQLILVARVNIDYHVAVDGHFYSVPYRLVHRRLDEPLADNKMRRR
jgi:Mu transposase, C-terminal domain